MLTQPMSSRVAEDPRHKPIVTDQAADLHFRALIAKAGRNPEDLWLGGYVEYEWEHGRHVYECVDETLAGKAFLEFGCNIGATSIVLACLGAVVTAVDVDRQTLDIAEANAARYGVWDKIRFLRCPDTTSLPFADAAFDRVVCNSVLEYVPRKLLRPIQREVDRVLKPGGIIFILGTSNRLAPREIHSRRWLVNYLPQWIDGLLPGGLSLQRGVVPWQVRYGFGDYENLDWLDRDRAYLASRKRMPGWKSKRFLRRAASILAHLAGISLGLLTPAMSLTLRKLPHR